jgi:ABC-type transport system involved in multi-copper enzyme maturation permease subunit
VSAEGTRVLRTVDASPARQLGRVVSAEWIKARSVPSTWSALGACVFIMASIGPAISSLEETGPGAPRSEPLLQMMAGVSMAQVALGVLGALLITGEHASGSIAGTLAAVPQRGTLLAGKALLLAALVAPFALLSCTLAALTSLPVLRGRGSTLTPTSPDVVAAVLATTLFLVLTALLGLAVGTLLRSTAGAVVVLTGLLFLLPVLVQLVPVLGDSLGPWLPTQAGSAVLVLGDRSGYLSPVGGQLLVAAYCGLALVAAAAVLHRRDA